MSWVRNDERTLTSTEGTNLLPAGYRLVLESRESREDDDRRVYPIENWPGYSAHIFTENLPRETRQKIGCMVACDIGLYASAHFSWPVDIIINAHGTVVGYIATRAAGMIPLSSLMFANEPSSFERRICIAKNLCIALFEFHQHGFVFGNLTLSSVFVDRASCRVFLNPGIDVQFLVEPRIVFPCTQGVSEYLAPEIHQRLQGGNGLRSISDQAINAEDSLLSIMESCSAFNHDTDLFALGVIIFSLLNDGKHPMSCIVNGKQNVSLGRSSVSSSQPRVLPSILGVLPKTSLFSCTLGVPNYRLFWLRFNGLGVLYDRCFGKTQTIQARPSERDWYALLERKSRGIWTRLARALNGAEEKLHALFSKSTDPVTMPHYRRMLCSRYPSDIAGSEAMSSPRVFWRTTGLYSLGFCLCTITHSLGFEAISLSVPGALIGALMGTVSCNCILGKSRRASGYKAHHYALSCICVSIITILCGALVGGVV